MSDYMKKLKSEHKLLQDQINALNNQMKESSKVLMKEAFREFFEKYDDVVENIFWRQYTPHFNDGEACEFSVHDVFILLKDDDDACDYEGSTLYDQDDVDELKIKIADFEEWEKDKMAAARKYQSDYIRKYNRNPFDSSYNWSNRNKTEEQMMREWTPHYGTKEKYLEELRVAEKFVEKYPNLERDFKVIRDTVNGIDEDLMEAMFGDHAKVIVSASGIEVEEYDHD